MKSTLAFPAVLLLALFVAGSAHGQEQSNADLAKASQNPVSDLISLPFQNNTNFNWGPNEKTQNVLNIQPVIPITLSDEWNLITRTIIPVVSQPGIPPSGDRTNGIGDTTFTGFISPKEPGGAIWGLGPVVLLPTATKDELGNDKWGLGASLIVLKIQGPWVVGSLLSNVWSVAGSGDSDINLLTWQPIINYNLPDSWYLTSVPIITANWEASSSNRWTIPLGGGFGKIFRIGKQPMNASMQAFYNIERPEYGADWTLRVQLQFLFPK
jgi:hypothetical protein